MSEINLGQWNNLVINLVCSLHLQVNRLRSLKVRVIKQSWLWEFGNLSLRSQWFFNQFSAKIVIASGTRISLCNTCIGMRLVYQKRKFNSGATGKTPYNSTECICLGSLVQKWFVILKRIASQPLPLLFTTPKMISYKYLIILSHFPHTLQPKNTPTHHPALHLRSSPWPSPKSAEWA